MLYDHFNDWSLSHSVTWSNASAHTSFPAIWHTCHLSHRRWKHVLLLNKYMCFKLHLSTLYIIHHGGSVVQRTLASIGTLSSFTKEGWTVNKLEQTSMLQGNTKGSIFSCYLTNWMTVNPFTAQIKPQNANSNANGVVVALWCRSQHGGATYN